MWNWLIASRVWYLPLRSRKSYYVLVKGCQFFSSKSTNYAKLSLSYFLGSWSEDHTSGILWYSSELFLTASYHKHSLAYCTFIPRFSLCMKILPSLINITCSVLAECFRRRYLCMPAPWWPFTHLLLIRATTFILPYPVRSRSTAQAVLLVFVHLADVASFAVAFMTHRILARFMFLTGSPQWGRCGKRRSKPLFHIFRCFIEMVSTRNILKIFWASSETSTYLKLN